MAGRSRHRGGRRRRLPAAARGRPPAPTPPPEHTLFEARRTTCPWCGSPALVDRVEVTDLLQHKPGRFHLDECTACGHVFQNPALSLAGLDHYYDQFYEGEGEEPWEFAFAAMGGAYRKRTDALARHAEPRAWLDVGTGHGHFCLAARQRWPEAVFDGLDLSESVEEAARRGWIDAGYRGLFPDLADSLSRSYDVVSMHHYLEHTREPRRELAAAAKALEPGGHLMIEGPDVDCPWSPPAGPLLALLVPAPAPALRHLRQPGGGPGGQRLRRGGGRAGAGDGGHGHHLGGHVLGQPHGARPRSPWRPPPTAGDRLRRFAVLGGVTRCSWSPRRPTRSRTPGCDVRAPPPPATPTGSSPGASDYSVQATANGGGSGTSSRLGHVHRRAGGSRRRQGARVAGGDRPPRPARRAAPSAASAVGHQAGLDVAVAAVADDRHRHPAQPGRW